MKNIISKIKKTKIYKIIQKTIWMDKKYSMSIISSAISFYMISSIILIIIIGVQILNYSSGELNDFLFSKILDIFKEEIITKIETSLPAFSLNQLSSLIILNIMWSSSAILNAYNRVADNIYVEIPLRVAYRNRISAFFMFFMIIFILFFEILFLLFSKNLINRLFASRFILLQKIILFIIEIIVIFFVIFILYIYAPPKKMEGKEVIIGSLLSTLTVYLLLQIFIFIVSLYEKLSSGYVFLSIITFSFSFLFIINYAIILGLKLNYEIGRKFMIKNNLKGKNNSEYKE